MFQHGESRHWARDPMAQRFQRFSLRCVFEVTFVIGAGLAGYQAVYAGELNQWRGFQLRDGYWGTHFLSPMLYAMGNLARAVTAVPTVVDLTTGNNSSRSGTRTRTGDSSHRILNPVRLPIPPSGQSVSNKRLKSNAISSRLPAVYQTLHLIPRNTDPALARLRRTGNEYPLALRSRAVSTSAQV